MKWTPIYGFADDKSISTDEFLMFRSAIWPDDAVNRGVLLGWTCAGCKP